MDEKKNALGQPVGAPLPGWVPRPQPPHTPMEGRTCRLEALSVEQHAEALHAANALDREGRLWTYLPYGPFRTAELYAGWVEPNQDSKDPLFYAIVERSTKRPLGVASYLRIDPEMGVIEVGHLCYSPALQRTVVATEAMYLMMRQVFDELHYRRYEWKCDALNAPSRSAAERLGFRYEGIFRNAVVSKGRNRDTAWYSVIDSEWPELRGAFEAWLSSANFHASGEQRRSLTSMRAVL